mmetsp:Transcript_32393/g.57980  ORF Transcript_32393/g.57980 Transcript_32393/m.57980 type:complete len:175 (-) Transcript_32393:329-853(-)
MRASSATMGYLCSLPHDITNLTWDMGSLILAKRFQLSLCQAQMVLFLSSDNILIGVIVVITTALIAQGDTLRAERFCSSSYSRITTLVARLQFLSSVHVPVLAMAKISPKQKNGSNNVAITSCPRLSSYSTKGGIIASSSLNMGSSWHLGHPSGLHPTLQRPPPNHQDPQLGLS